MTYRNDRGRYPRDVTAGTAYRGVNARQAELADVNRDGGGWYLLTVGQRRLGVWLNWRSFPRQDFSYALREGRAVAVGDVNLDVAPDIYVVEGLNTHLYPRRKLINRRLAAPEHVGQDGRHLPRAREVRRHRHRHPRIRGTGRGEFFVPHCQTERTRVRSS